MQEGDVTLDWIINKYRSYFEKFNITSSDIEAKYSDWCKDHESESIADYLLHLLLSTGLFIAKFAATEHQGLEWKIELGTKMLEYCTLFQKSEIRKGIKHALTENTL